MARLSNIVQARAPSYTARLASQGYTGMLLRLQSALLAMHNSFLVGALLALVALGAMWLAPRGKKREHTRPDPLPVEAEMAAGD